MSTSKSAVRHAGPSVTLADVRSGSGPSLHSLPTCPHRSCRDDRSRATGHTGRMGLFDRFRRGSRTRMRAPGARRRPHRLDHACAPPTRADEQHLREFVDRPPRRRGLRRAAHRGQRRDPAAGRPRRRVDPPPGAVGRLGAQVLQQAPGAVVRRRRGRRPAADARLQPPQEAAEAASRRRPCTAVAGPTPDRAVPLARTAISARRAPGRSRPGWRRRSRCRPR